MKRAKRKPARKKPEPTPAERRRALAALKRESHAVLLAQIRELLALPMEERTHFLRVQMPGGGTAL
jgi:hypothetical protein